MKKIIILDAQTDPGGGLNVHVCGWFPVEAGREIPIPGATSIYRDATDAELLALQLGEIIEESDALQYPATWRLAQIRGDLVTKYNARAIAILWRELGWDFLGALR